MKSFFKVAGSLRVFRPVISVQFESDEEQKPAVPRLPAPDAPLERLVKLIPSEGVTAYVAGRSIAGTAVDWWALACLILVVLLRAFATAPVGVSSVIGKLKNAQWGAVAISAVSFFIWVHALGNHLPGLSRFTDKPASLALILWTPLAAAIYRGSAPNSKDGTV